MGRGELQGTSKRVLEERVQDSSAARTIRNREKTTLNLKFLRMERAAFLAVVGRVLTGSRTRPNLKPGPSRLPIAPFLSGSFHEK